MLVYLGICAILAFAAAVAAALAAIPPAPTFHVAFAAGAMPLICGAIIHFVPVLTRTGEPAAAMRRLPVLVQLAGVVVPFGLGGVLPQWSLHAAASATAAVALILLFWTMRRLRATLGAPHPGARWYGAALLCLFFAVSLVPLWLALPELRPALRLFHLHLNTSGFIGLAALGTLPVLLPTAAGQPDPDAARRLSRHLLPAAVGAVLVAAGAAGSFWLALPGALLLAWVAAADLAAWQQANGQKLGAGNTAPLATATAGFLLLLVAGIAHGAGWIPARPALAAFVALFLLPLVSGALAQLLPVWRYPGADSPRRRAMRDRLAAGGQLRAILFLCAGGLLVFDNVIGWGLAAAGLLTFMVAVGQAFRLDRSRFSNDNPRPE